MTADDARMPAAVRLTAANCISASVKPMTMIATKTSRRSSRRRVSATAESSPPRTDAASFVPRRTSARSTISAKAVANRIVAAAVTSSRWSSQNPAAVGTMTTCMASEVRAVLLDGMGTLVHLIPPGRALAAAFGVDLETAERAFRAEVDYYLAHQLEGSDPAALADLRERAAAVLADAAGVPREGAVHALMGSLRFEAFDDAAPALEELRARGMRLVVVSNWDWSLTDVLGGAGLLPLLDGVITSAEVGAAKPDRAIFEAGLTAAGCSAGEAVHVGDSAEDDVEGARAAGIRPLLLAREGGGDLRSLDELPALLS